MRGAIAALAVLGLSACSVDVGPSGKSDGGNSGAGGYTLEVRADEGQQVYIVTSPEGERVAGRTASGVSTLLGAADLITCPTAACAPPGANDVSIQAPGFSLRASGDETKDGGDGHVSVNLGGMSVNVDAQENGPGEGDDHANVRTPHVHLNDPGREEWEGFATGTRALAAGGTTCCVDMPLNALPPTLDGQSFDAKVAAATGTAHVDVALWGGLVPGDADRLDELAARGVVGFKAFMSATGTPEFERADDLTLLDGMARAARLGLPVAVHAESDAITAGLAARAVAAGRTTMRDYLDSRPVVAELEAIGRAIALAEETGCALHVVHVSSGRGVAAISRARARGVDVTCETCPHFLVLDEDDAAGLGAVAKCAPPLRPRGEADALWSQLAGGEIDLVASDHSPAPPELRAVDDLFAAWGGIAGAQLLLALVWSEGAAARGLPPARAAVRDGGGRALRAGAGQGRAAGRRRRRPRARRPGGHVDGRGR